VELGVLGPLEAQGVGGTVRLRPLERRLVAALAAARPAAVGVDALVDALWSDRSPRSAVHTVRTHIGRARQVLDDGFVVTVEGGYRLGDDVAVDADAFVELSRMATATRDSVRAVGLWASVLALWRGEPFADLADWPAAVAERARLTELVLVAQEEWCAARIAAGVTVETVADVEGLVEREPVRERRWALLMEALDAAGRRGEALRTFDRARRVLATELGVSPGHELAQLREALLRTDGPGPTTSHERRPGVVRTARSVAAPISSLIGRDALVDDVRGACARWRLVTLTGVGGVGKSRVALAVTDPVPSSYPGGCWFVGLVAADRTSADIDLAVARAVGLVTAGGRTVRDIVTEAIVTRRLLLVLDNCEHVIDAVAAFVADALDRCPDLHVLATSRAPLRIPGERLITVGPLPIDAGGRELFLARAAEGGATLTDHDEQLVESVARRLAGIPLVIELAAAQVRTLGLATVAERLEQRLDVVTGGSRSVVDHHRTVRKALQWSLDLLDTELRCTLARLGVFVGPFDLDAVAAVDAARTSGTDPVERVVALVDASLVVADGDQPLRFRLLEPVRRFAVEQLEVLGETERMGAIHARYFTARAERLAAELDTADEVTAANRVGVARDDLREAFRFATTTGDCDSAVRLTVALGRYAEVHIWRAPWSWCEDLLVKEGVEVHPQRPALLAMAAVGAWQLGDHERCLARADEAISFSAPGEESWLDAHRFRASGLMWLGRIDEGINGLRTAIGHDTECTPRSIAARCTLALLLNHAGEPDRVAARQLLRDAEALGNPTARAAAHHTYGVMLGRSDVMRALHHQREAAQLAEMSGAALIHGFALAALASLAGATGSDPGSHVRAIADVTAHYLRVGNHTHVRSFARGAIGPLAACGDEEGVVTLDAATRDQPAFAGLGAEIEAAIREAHRHIGEADDCTRHGAAMTDDELVDWLRHRADPPAPAPAPTR
jgi:predicted ATPase/DNA-binding SARP family transcriptional activator